MREVYRVAPIAVVWHLQTLDFPILHETNLSRECLLSNQFSTKCSGLCLPPKTEWISHRQSGLTVPVQHRAGTASSQGSSPGKGSCMCLSCLRELFQIICWPLITAIISLTDSAFESSSSLRGIEAERKFTKCIAVKRVFYGNRRVSKSNVIVSKDKVLVARKTE